MKKFHPIWLAPLFCALLVSCATLPPDRYNTQRGAVIGAGAGALIGQAIGGNTEGTLIGLAAGTLLGGLVGNAVDQDYQAAREAARHDRSAVYYDGDGRAVETFPEASDDPNCRRVRKRVWEDGKLVKETVEETCGPPPPPPEVRYYPAPPPPCYGWWAWPLVPRISLYYGKTYYRGHYHHPRHRAWGCR